jgi:hypothetical protein
MNNKVKYIWGGIVIVALIFGGYLWYESQAKKGDNAKKDNSELNQSADVGKSVRDSDPSDSGNGLDSGSDTEDINFNALCENGEWVNISDLSGNTETVSGTLRKVYPDDEASSEFSSYSFYIEGSPSLGISGKDLTKLDYFEDREVELQGIKESGGKSISAVQIKCTGKETDKDLIGKKNSLMKYLAANINSIAPQKAPYEKWTIDIVDFVDENNVYVEYYDTVEDNENSDVDADTGRRVLLETSPKAGGGYDVKVLAYWEMGEDDFVLKTGTDKFEDAEDVTSYQYDSEGGSWERID